MLLREPSVFRKLTKTGLIARLYSQILEMFLIAEAFVFSLELHTHKSKILD